MKSFSSVSTNAARFQDISLNPQKLAGMCAKLKCCLNYEVDDYMEAGKRIPGKDVILQTHDNDYYLFKTDILAGLITYSTDKRLAANLETITATRAHEIIEMNKRGEKPISLQADNTGREPDRPIDLLAGESLTRFDRSKKKKKNRNKQKQGGDQQPKQASQQPKQGAKQPKQQGEGQKQQGGNQQPKQPKQQGGNQHPKQQGAQQPKQQGDAQKQKQQGNKRPKQRPQGQPGQGQQRSNEPQKENKE